MSNSPNDRPDIPIESAKQNFEVMPYHLQNVDALSYAASEYLNIPRADIEDTLAVSGNSPLVQRALETLSIVAQAQSGSENGLFLSFPNINSELMSLAHEQRQEPDTVKLTIVADASYRKTEFEDQDPAWTGALIASRSHEGQEDEFLFAIVGNDPKKHNPLAANNSAIIFANMARMTPERRLRALRTFSRMAHTLHDEQTIALPPDQLVPSLTRDLMNGVLFGKQVKAKTYGSHQSA